MEPTVIGKPAQPEQIAGEGFPEKGFRKCKNSDLTQGTNSVHGYGYSLFTISIQDATYSDSQLDCVGNSRGSMQSCEAAIGSAFVLF
ncbi:hypothetical protein Poly51_60390 [Rubripirellula tenax]|uniref:Uncharacterized protein n=1 Tax=Rubripirellula tenax TaxID=2528015 RepID=A0A5C6E6Y8_9BACT|nr:hypothetical protein Poly51_60390 [Rubripirellula tenax]